MNDVNDAISRQAAIGRKVLLEDWTGKEHYAVLVTDIEQLPPIQLEIVRCKDCKHWKDSDGVFRRGIGVESKCPLNLHQVYEGTFFCGLGERKEVAT